MEKWRSRVGSLPACMNKATGQPRALKKLRLSGGSYLDRLLSNTCENFRLISISMHLAAISTFFPCTAALHVCNPRWESVKRSSLGCIQLLRDDVIYYRMT